MGGQLFFVTTVSVLHNVERVFFFPFYLAGAKCKVEKSDLDFFFLSMGFFWRWISEHKGKQFRIWTDTKYKRRTRCVKLVGRNFSPPASSCDSSGIAALLWRSRSNSHYLVVNFQMDTYRYVSYLKGKLNWQYLLVLVLVRLQHKCVIRTYADEQAVVLFILLILKNKCYNRKPQLSTTRMQHQIFYLCERSCFICQQIIPTNQRVRRTKIFVFDPVRTKDLKVPRCSSGPSAGSHTWRAGTETISKYSIVNFPCTCRGRHYISEISGKISSWHISEIKNSTYLRKKMCTCHMSKSDGEEEEELEEEELETEGSEEAHNQTPTTLQ